jgi:phosphoglycerate dehydrogenase-like enzyme
MTSKTKVVFLDDQEYAFRNSPEIAVLSNRGHFSFFHGPLTPTELVSEMAEAEVLVLMRDRTAISANELKHAKRLKAIVYTGNRNNRLDAQACQDLGIQVLNTEFGPSKSATAELTWALILANLKKLEAGFANIRQTDRDWRQGIEFPDLTQVLEGETLGVIGLGVIGQKVAKVAQAFGMQVLAWSPNLTEDRARASAVELVSKMELLRRSKVVTLHMVLSPSTQHLLTEDELLSMRSDSLLVNTSRSALINEDVLLSALAAGRPAMAALDVFDVEPLPNDHPFRTMPNVTMTPHLGFVANPVYATFTETVAKHLDGLLPR